MQQYDETDLEPTVNTLDGQRQWQLFPPGERRTRRRSLLSGLLVLVLLAGVSAWIVVATGRTSPPTASIKPAPIPTPTPPFIISPTPHSAAYATLAARPLAIPTVASFNDCPTSPGHRISTDLGTAIGTGPLYLVVGYSNGSVPYWPGPWEDHTGWGGIPLALSIFPTSFSGPVLVRGESLDGQGAVLFNQYGGPLLTEAQIDVPVSKVPVSGASPQYAGVGGWYIRFNASGCYGLQVDWPQGTETIIFSAM